MESIINIIITIIINTSRNDKKPFLVVAVAVPHAPVPAFLPFLRKKTQIAETQQIRKPNMADTTTNNRLDDQLVD